MSTRRVAVGRLWQETNTFTEARTTLAEFKRYTFLRGPELLAALRKQDDELAGFTDVLDPHGVQYVPLLAASTFCGGPVVPEVVQTITGEVLDALHNEAEVDAVLLTLHGAMAGLDTPDLTGHLLSAIRSQVGSRVPIVATLDHHANVTDAMARAADVLTAYHDCPHTDLRETGRRGARLLLGLLDGDFKPSMAFRKLPLITPAETFETAKPPLRDWFERARAIERRPGVVDVSLCPVFPWMDVPELGWSVLVVTDNDPALAAACCDELAAFAWERRRQFFVKKCAPDEAIRLAAAYPEGPVVIPDGADATNGGAPGDSPCLLREMLAQNIACTAMLTLVDPDAVAAAYAAGAGATIDVSIGAKLSRDFHQPLPISARVARFSDGCFDITGHITTAVNMGRCALLEIGPVKILVSELAGPGHDPQVYRHIGLEPRDAQIVVVKATVGHMHAYRDIMKLNLPTECPGPCASYLERLLYRRIPRPIFPFDEEMQWSPGLV